MPAQDQVLNQDTDPATDPRSAQPLRHRLSRHTGPVLVGVGAIHIAVFTILGFPAVVEILQAGVFNAIGDDFGRGLFWYGGWFAGALMILLGLVLTSWVRTTERPIPRYFGVFVVVMGAVLMVLQPASGGFLVVITGAIALCRPPRTEQSPTPRSAAGG